MYIYMYICIYIVDVWWYGMLVMYDRPLKRTFQALVQSAQRYNSSFTITTFEDKYLNDSMKLTL